MPDIFHEQQAANAFSKQAPLFDSIYDNDFIVQYKRERVRAHVTGFLNPQSVILELNAGTGEDAVYFAKAGHTIHATDISEAMQNVLQQKIKSCGVEEKVTTEICSFNQLENLKNKGPYDFVFSNFAGLNCTSDLQKVLQDCSALIKQNGYLTVVVMPSFCLWEFMLLFKGNFKTAFRRFAGKQGAEAHVEGKFFRCWYYNPSFIKQTLQKDFKVIGLEGLCVILPPSYFKNFSTKNKKLFAFFKKAEHKLKSVWPFRNLGDYYILTLQKK
ncbi:MAG: class I SAM-dependent methyltransferase [Chitinophagales bacterium]